jgi:hypothetical protein
MAADFSLRGATLYVLFFAFILFLGVLELRKTFEPGDHFYAYSGALTVFIGMIGILHSIRILHGVIHRGKSDPPSLVPR